MSLSVAMIITGAIVLLAAAIGFIVRAQDGRRRSGGTVRVRAEDLPRGALAPVTLVQFSTELCARCPQVRRLLGDIARDNGIPRVEIDLTHRSDLAAHYRVLQTPTTILVDASGTVLSRWGGVPERRSIEDAVASHRDFGRWVRAIQEPEQS